MKSLFKKVINIYQSGSTHWVGDGFPVRNLIPTSGLDKDIDPFLMLDYAGPTQFEATNQPHGVGEHPHRGFETVTIAYQGSVEHRDSAGHSGIIYPGDVQWMTAGSGVVHEEMHEHNFAKSGGTFEMIQLWVNLPRAYKMTKPRYQTIKDRDIPIYELGNKNYARVIAGSIDGIKGPAQTFTPINLLDIKMTTGTATLNLPQKYHTALFLLHGSIYINDDCLIDGEAKIALLDTSGESLSLTAQRDSRLLVLSGEPIDEPVASYGPFVMNTQEELLQAVRDYQTGRMGHISDKQTQIKH